MLSVLRSNVLNSSCFLTTRSRATLLGRACGTVATITSLASTASSPCAKTRLGVRMSSIVPILSATAATVVTIAPPGDGGASGDCASVWTQAVSLVSTIDPGHPMLPVLLLALLQALMGAGDNLVHHELLLRLPWTSTAGKEQLLHAVRQVLYALVFLSLAGVTPTGIYAYGLLGILGIETGLTVADFLEEDRSRLLPWTERIAHTLLTVNYGAILALWVPVILTWAALPTGISLINYGVPSFINGAVALGVLIWGIRDFLASRRIYKFNQLETTHPFTLQLSNPRQSILVTGGTGFIGQRLCKALLREGHDVTILVRDRKKAGTLFSDSTGKLTFISSFDDLNSDTSYFDIVVNLAGDPIGDGRWTSAKKERMFTSRVRLTQDLVSFLKKLNTPPKTLISGSAIGYYGINSNQSDLEFTEESSSLSEGGLSHSLCDQWEQTALEACQLGTRVVLLRTGIVLGREGGALSKMLIPFELGLGGTLGNGRQWMPWIHIEDVLRIIGRAIDSEISGPVNTTAPVPVTNYQFTKSLGGALRRPTLIPLPSFVLSLLFGKEMSHELLLTGTRVLPKKLKEHGFQFLYPTIDAALHNLVRGEPAENNQRGSEPART